MSSTKLTLNIQQSVISKAKIYAKQKNVSLSQIVENYLNKLAEEGIKPSKVSPWVKDLVAVEKPMSDFDHKKLNRDRVADKYSKE